MDSYLGQRWNLLGFFGSGARCRLPADPCRQALARSRAAATARGTHSHQYPSAPTRGDWSLDPQTSLSHAVGHSGLCFFFCQVSRKLSADSIPLQLRILCVAHTLLQLWTA